ncbi:MAG: DUF2341 domain-containing protein [Candidatus Aenigmarchaeota archaeon]|nr:DUF2341 domain-containing protein [Candidatus Aenigmarchaeota archaeon]
MKYALLVLLIFILIGSGCVGLTPEGLAYANPLVKEFMEQYPNAQVQVTHFTALQSLRMLENMSVDCGKNITAKEFYRITIDDPDSRLNVVAWVDWEDKKLECAVKYGVGENKTISKPGEPIKNCTSHAEFKCYGDHVYWFDSCGHKQEKKEYCEYGCELGFCKEKKEECEPHAEMKCHEGHVFWYDSCGNREEKKEYCEYGCENGTCINETTNCTSHYEYRCYSGHVYWYDSCGSKEEKKEFCNYGCDNGECKTEPIEECIDSDGGKNYYVKGTVTKGTQSLSDHCNEDGTLTEKYCENNEIKAEKMNCSEGYECSDGKCAVKEPEPGVSWYYPNWPYRQMISITNNVSTLENYQVKIVFDSSNIDYSKTIDDGSDLRFTYYDSASEEEQEVSYWIENWDEASESIVWLKSPRIDGIYYVYYGNWENVSKGNGENTFEFFDDFNEWDNSEWGNQSDCVTLENSILTLTTNNSECGLLSKTTFGVDYSLIVKFKDNVKGVVLHQATWTGWWRSDNLVLAQLHSWSPDEKFWFETKIHPSANSYITGEDTDTDWHVVEIKRNSTNSPVFNLDDKYLWDNSPDKPMPNLGIRLRCLSYAGYSGGASFDYIFVRKYSFPEPTYTIGEIEHH